MNEDDEDLNFLNWETYKEKIEDLDDFLWRESVRKENLKRKSF